MIADDFDTLAFVTAACPAVGFSFAPARLVELSEAFALIMRVAAPALALQVPDAAEPAPVFVA